MPFKNNSKVSAIKLVHYLNWAHESFDPTGHSPPSCGVLALPPLQRSAAWNPRQVVDSWDSVLRGLPLGAFTVQRRPDGLSGRGFGVSAHNHPLSEGWDLLDGQQRTRSLLLGLHGPNLSEGSDDRRCLWIDLDKKPEQSLFDLQLTSASQPFGYGPSGYKLNPTDRLRARERFEPQGTEIRTKRGYAYSHELFEGFIKEGLELHSSDGNQRLPDNGYPGEWPPPPARIDRKRLAPGGTIMPLHEILRTWTQATEPKDEALAVLVSRDHSRFECLYKALMRFDEAEIALIDASSVESRNLPIFYDRIGAGGTALSTEERLFSIYKSKRPAFHNIVRDIYKDSGRVMVPSKIAASAIRISNALAHQQRDQ